MFPVSGREQRRMNSARVGAACLRRGNFYCFIPIWNVLHTHVDLRGSWENVPGPDGIIVYVGHVLTGTVLMSVNKYFFIWRGN